MKRKEAKQMKIYVKEGFESRGTSTQRSYVVDSDELEYGDGIVKFQYKGKEYTIFYENVAGIVEHYGKDEYE